MANLTNSAKLIQEMAKKANRTELPEVNNSTVNFTINGNTGSQSMTTNQPNNSTVNLTVDKATVGLGNVDNTSDANKPISTATQAALDLKADKSDLSSVYKYKGSVASYSNLPSTGLTAGDVYNVEDTGMNYAWTGSAWDALGSSVDLSNYLAKNNTTAFTPSGDYNPATKKYVDDNVADMNTKTFYLSSTSDLTNAQAAYDWYAAGKTPILNHQNGIYLLSRGGSGELQFVEARGNKDEGATKTSFYHKMFVFNISNGAVTSIDSTNYKNGTSYFLQTDRNYSTPYTPQYDGSPATKKYVDDLVGDIETLLVAL